MEGVSLLRRPSETSSSFANGIANSNALVNQSNSAIHQTTRHNTSQHSTEFIPPKEQPKSYLSPSNGQMFPSLEHIVLDAQELLKDQDREGQNFQRSGINRNSLSNLLRKAETGGEIKSKQQSQRLKQMTNVIRKKIFKMNEKVGSDVPRKIQREEAEVVRQKRIMREILRKGSNEKHQASDQVSNGEAILAQSNILNKHKSKQQRNSHSRSSFIYQHRQ